MSWGGSERREKVELALRVQLAALNVGGKVAARLPDGHMVSDARQRMARAEKRARMSLYYSRIYGAYANMYAALIVMALMCSGLITLLFRLRDRVLSWQKGLVQW